MGGRQRQNLKYKIEALRKICAMAAAKGLLAGWSGNASMRLGGQRFVITASGVSKSDLKERDFIVMTDSGEKVSGIKKPSSEWRLHAVLYSRIPGCQAILHTHPANLQALSLACDGVFAFCELYEAKVFRKKLFLAKDAEPGSEATGESTWEALNGWDGLLPAAIWLPRHGLCAIGADLESALNLTEELEHLAEVELKYLAVKS